MNMRPYWKAAASRRAPKARGSPHLKKRKRACYPGSAASGLPIGTKPRNKTSNRSRSAAAPMKLFTIGFTQKTAEQFFTRLKQPGLYACRCAAEQRLAACRLHQEERPAVLSSRDLPYRLRPSDGVGPRARHPRCLQEKRRRLVGLRGALPGPNGRTPRRGNGRQGSACGGVPAVQRGHARALSSPAGCRVPCARNGATWRSSRL